MLLVQYGISAKYALMFANNVVIKNAVVMQEKETLF